jgi:hypothetical protein
LWFSWFHPGYFEINIFSLYMFSHLLFSNLPTIRSDMVRVLTASSYKQ